NANRGVVQRYVDALFLGIKKVKSDRAFGVEVLKKYFQSTDDKAMGATYDFYALTVTPSQPVPRPEQFADAQATLGATNAKVKDVEGSGDLELTGVQKHFAGSYPILFDNVKGYPHARAITNLFANMDIVDRFFGYKDATDRTRRLAHALTHPIPSEVIPQDEAPCQEEIVTDDLDVNRYIMAIRHTHLEGEITIGSGNSVVVGKYFWGGSHIGYNRMNFRWGNVGTFQSSLGSHMWQIITDHYNDTEPIPLTVCFGLPVASTLLAGGGFDYVVLPRGGDELGAAGAVQGFPTRLVKARTVDAYAVADSEYVLEGYLYPKDKRYETKEAEEHDTQGRFHFHPEWAGYMGKAYRTQSFHVTGITMRKRASRPLIYPMGVHMYDCNNIDTTDDIIWSLTTRVNPNQDLLKPVPGGAGQTFIPSERVTAGSAEWTGMNIRFEGGMGIDATVPYGLEKDFMRPVYPIDRVDP